MSKFKISRIAFKSLLTYTALLFIFAVTMCIIGYRGFTEVLLRMYTRGGFRIAAAARYDIDADQLDAYLESGGNTDGYQESWDRLDKLCNASDATFIYVIRPDETDYGHVKYIFSTVNHNSKYSPYEVGYIKETTNDEYRVKYRRMMEGESDAESLVLQSRQYSTRSHHITVMTSLKGSDNKTKALLCVQRQMTTLAVSRIEYIIDVIQATLVLVILANLLNTLYQRKALLIPLQKITEEASRFAKENNTTGKKLTDEIRNNDEIGLLAASIDSMEEKVVNYVEEVRRFTAEKERDSTELALAAAIQDGMLPNQFPAFPDRTEFDIFASMDPAREVGGDFYDFFLIDDDHLCLEIADVSGKGIPGALVMMASKIMLTDFAMTLRDPAEILHAGNNAMCGSNPDKVFVTVWLGILEISTGRLTAANAGHEYPILKKPDGKYEMIKDKHGFVIGGMEDMAYKNYELQLEPGTKLFLYTDGLPEAEDADHNMFGIDRILTALNEQPDAAPEQVLSNMTDAVNAFVKETEQFDDLTMLCLEYKGPAAV